MLARRHSDDSASNPCRELAYFITTGIVISRAPVEVAPTPPTSTATPDSNAITTTLAPNTTTTTTVITGGACGFVLTANAIMFLTILGFFITFDGDDVQYSVW